MKRSARYWRAVDAKWKNYREGGNNRRSPRHRASIARGEIKQAATREEALKPNQRSIVVGLRMLIVASRIFWYRDLCREWRSACCLMRGIASRSARGRRVSSIEGRAMRK